MVPCPRSERCSDSSSLASTGTTGVWWLGNGEVIDANDLWIAPAALALGMPVVKRSEKGFARVRELNVIGYG